MHFRIFDCWRFTAAILIMAYHFLFFAPVLAAVPRDFLHRLLPLLDMFFMISGFLITTRYGAKLDSPAAYLDFLRRRVARLYPLHLLTLAFFVCIALVAASGIVESAEPRRWDLSMLPANLLAVHAWGTTDYLAFNYPSWSVSAEFFCYALFPLIVVAARRTGLAGLVLLFSAWILGLEIAAAQGAFPGGWMSADTLGAYRAFPDFVLGAIVAMLVERRAIEIRSHLPGIATLGLAAVAMVLQWNGYIALFGFALAMLFTALAETARPDSTKWLAPFAPVTGVSFGIYLLHPVIETLFFSILWKHLVEPTHAVSFYVFMLLPMVVTVPAAILSDRLFERRIGAWISGRKRRSGPRAMPVGLPAERVGAAPL